MSPEAGHKVPSFHFCEPAHSVVRAQTSTPSLRLRCRECRHREEKQTKDDEFKRLRRAGEGLCAASLDPRPSWSWFPSLEHLGSGLRTKQASGAREGALSTNSVKMLCPDILHHQALTQAVVARPRRPAICQSRTDCPEIDVLRTCLENPNTYSEMSQHRMCRTNPLACPLAHLSRMPIASPAMPCLLRPLCRNGAATDGAAKVRPPKRKGIASAAAH